MPRAESKPMQFGGDWPGVFVRGDTAGWWNHLLEALFSADNDAARVSIIQLMELNGMRGGLFCRAQELSPDQIQMMKPFDECVIKQE